MSIISYIAKTAANARQTTKFAAFLVAYSLENPASSGSRFLLELMKDKHQFEVFCRNNARPDQTLYLTDSQRILLSRTAGANTLPSSEGIHHGRKLVRNALYAAAGVAGALFVSRMSQAIRDDRGLSAGDLLHMAAPAALVLAGNVVNTPEVIRYVQGADSQERQDFLVNCMEDEKLRHLAVALERIEPELKSQAYFKN